MKTLVAFYSNKGSNLYLAEKTAAALNADIVELKTIIPAFGVIATAIRFSLGNLPLRKDITAYDRVVLCGPIYTGSFAAACRNFIRKYGKKVKKLDVITCCGCPDEKKNDKYGYAAVFEKLQEQLGDRCGSCQAFPIDLVLTEEQKADDLSMLNTRLGDGNFSGAIRQRFDEFISQIVSA